MQHFSADFSFSTLLLVLNQVMDRKYVKKNPETTPAELMNCAVDLVLKEGRPAREVARDLAVPRTTLIRYIKDAKESGNIETIS